MFRWRRRASLGCALTLLAQTTWATTPYAYASRGAGEGQRFEGVKTEPYAGSLTLLSFTVGGAATPDSTNADRMIRIRFSSSNGADVGIRVRELQSEKSYLLEARHPWGAVSNEFAWPTSDVLIPLGVNIRNLGVVVGSNPGKSGLVVPARLSGALVSGPEPKYHVVLRSRFTCAPMLAEISRVASDGTVTRVSRQSHREVAALVPTPLEFETSGMADGSYVLTVSCERKGSGVGAGADSYQEVAFDFRHDSSFVNAGRTNRALR